MPEANNELTKELIDKLQVIARLDERTKAMQDDNTKYQEVIKKAVEDIKIEVRNYKSDTDTKLADMRVTTEDKLSKAKKDAEERFVTKQEFAPVQRLVYGVTSIMLTGVVVGLLALVVMK